MLPSAGSALLSVGQPTEKKSMLHSLGKSQRGQPLGSSQAGYYSDRLHGRRTASGEIFDQNQFTASHHNLPFGSVVRVTYPRSGRAADVRVNDRCTDPYSMSLSSAAAGRLGMQRQGVVPVNLSLLSLGSSGASPARSAGYANASASGYDSPYPDAGYGHYTQSYKSYSSNYNQYTAANTQTVTSQPSAWDTAAAAAPALSQPISLFTQQRGYEVQFGAYQEREKAQKAAWELGHRSVPVQVYQRGSWPNYRVIGNWLFTTPEDASRWLSQLRSNGSVADGVVIIAGS